MSDDIDRAELWRLHAAATPGPWEAQDYDDHPGDEGSCVLTHEPERGTRAIAYAIAYPWTTPESCEADAELIAKFRTAVPALLDAVEQTEAERDTLSANLGVLVRLNGRAEARIQAVRDVLDDPGVGSWTSHDQLDKEIRRALEE